jgi:hypothetical protein
MQVYRILLVEDHESTRKAVTALLTCYAGTDRGGLAAELWAGAPAGDTVNIARRLPWTGWSGSTCWGAWGRHRPGRSWSRSGRRW